MTDDIVPDMRDAIVARIDAVLAGRPDPGSPIPDRVRRAIRAGHVGQVGIYCDSCGTLVELDCIGETRDDRFAAARRHLADVVGWRITAAADLCPDCARQDGS